jgi:succinyl-CoA synthetase alpha subunit
MSKIALSGNASGTGTLTIAAPNTNSDATINLPTVTGGSFVVSNASGNVGIGTDSPVTKLHVEGTGAQEPIALFSSTNNDVSIRLLGGNVGNPDEVYIEFADRDDASNSFAIGMDDDASKLFFGYGTLGTMSGHSQMALTSAGQLQTKVTGASTQVMDTYGCRAWVNFNGDTSPGTIRASGNVSSVTRSATGTYAINFSTAMPDANYATVLTTSDVPTVNRIVVINRDNPGSTTAVNIYSSSASGVLNNQPILTVAVFR